MKAMMAQGSRLRPHRAQRPEFNPWHYMPTPASPDVALSTELPSLVGTRWIDMALGPLYHYLEESLFPNTHRKTESRQTNQNIQQCSIH